MSGRATRAALRLLAVAIAMTPLVALTSAPASAASLVFTLPSTAQTGDTVVAELANPTGASEEFSIDWGDNSTPGLFGDLSSCSVTAEGGTYAPGEKPRESGSCTLKHAYRSPGTFRAVATTKTTRQTFTTTITVTGPSLRPVDAQFTFTGLGPVTVNTTPFTVTATGPAPVCWLQFNGIRMTGSAAGTFTLNVADYRPNSTSSLVFVRFCDGGEDNTPLPTSVPFQFSSFQNVVRAEPGYDREASWTVDNETTEVATVSLIRGGTALGSTTAPAGGYTTLATTLPAQPASEPTRRYTLVVTTPSGLRTELPVIGARGWSLADQGPGPLAAPCATVRWSYDKKGQPRASSLMLQDITATLTRVSALTGLRFARTNVPTAAQLRFRWTPAKSLAGVGTTASTGQPVIATIDLGAKNWWNANTWRGFSPNVRQGVPGHNWDLAAAVLTALGLGYTGQTRNLMNEVSDYGQWQPQNARFGIGDRAGLTYLYQPQTCGRTQ
jgi:hypothetical protein